MTDVSASYSASLAISNRPIRMFVPTDVPNDLLANVGAVETVLPGLSGNRQEAGILAPRRDRPNWLPVVERRIARSVASDASEFSNDGRWLMPEIANASRLFLENIADILPSEPYIYSAREGDLVAEFESGQCRLTAIISATTVRLFAAIPNHPPEYRKVELVDGPDALRQQLRHLIGMCDAAQHGAVESR